MIVSVNYVNETEGQTRRLELTIFCTFINVNDHTVLSRQIQYPRVIFWVNSER